jgi:hypothetical protein
MVKAETRAAAAAKGLRQSTETRNARAEMLGPDDGPQTGIRGREARRG